MPYIKKMERAMFAKALREVRHSLILDENPGHLNYIITAICDEWLSHHGPCYSKFNEVIGVLECAKQELYRRVVGPYEDYKMEVTGDVYDPRLITDSIGRKSIQQEESHE